LDLDDIHISCEVLISVVTSELLIGMRILEDISSDEHVEMDGIFQVDMDSDGKCKEFRQWYVSKLKISNQ
jgi:hypothetical protein